MIDRTKFSDRARAAWRMSRLIPLESMNVSARRSIVTWCPSASISARAVSSWGAVAISSSPTAVTHAKAPRRVTVTSHPDAVASTDMPMTQVCPGGRDDGASSVGSQPRRRLGERSGATKATGDVTWPMRGGCPARLSARRFDRARRTALGGHTALIGSTETARGSSRRRGTFPYERHESVSARLARTGITASRAIGAAVEVAVLVATGRRPHSGPRAGRRRPRRRAGYYAQCDTTAPQGGTAFFGGPEAAGAYDGMQAELVRVPFANAGCVKLPDEVTDHSDIFPIAWFGARLPEVDEGDTVTVLGAGPMGIFAVISAFLQGAGRVISVDRPGSSTRRPCRPSHRRGDEQEPRDPRRQLQPPPAPSPS
jgi:hypothetical protein